MGPGRAAEGDWPERGSRRRVGLAALLLVVLWLVVGFVRAPIVARGYIAAGESPRAEIQIESLSLPVIPPFFVVQADATISEPGGAPYWSRRVLWVEPLTGIVIDLSPATCSCEPRSAAP